MASDGTLRPAPGQRNFICSLRLKLIRYTHKGPPYSCTHACVIAPRTDAGDDAFDLIKLSHLHFLCRCSGPGVLHEAMLDGERRQRKYFQRRGTGRGNHIRRAFRAFRTCVCVLPSLLNCVAFPTHPLACPLPCVPFFLHHYALFFFPTASHRRCGTRFRVPVRPCHHTAWPSSGMSRDRISSCWRTPASTRTVSQALQSKCSTFLAG